MLLPPPKPPSIGSGLPGKVTVYGLPEPTSKLTKSFAPGSTDGNQLLGLSKLPLPTLLQVMTGAYVDAPPTVNAIAAVADKPNFTAFRSQRLATRVNKMDTRFS